MTDHPKPEEGMTFEEWAEETAEEICDDILDLMLSRETSVCFGPAIISALKQAHAKGERSMREESAWIAGGVGKHSLCRNHGWGLCQCDQIEKAIRALTIKAEEK